LSIQIKAYRILSLEIKAHCLEKIQSKVEEATSVVKEEKMLYEIIFVGGFLGTNSIF
jgi:hypothetical protein